LLPLQAGGTPQRAYQHDSPRRLFCNPCAPRGDIIRRCGCVYGDNFYFARPALKAKQVDAQEPAKLRRGDYDSVSWRSAFQERISHPGTYGCQHRKATQAAVLPGTHPMTGQLMTLHEEGLRLNIMLHLEIESYYLFAKIMLDKIVHALEFYFGQGRNISLDSHDNLVKYFEAYAEQKGLVLPLEFMVMAKTLKTDISDYRDYDIAHEKSPRRMSGTMFDSEGNMKMTAMSLYPTEKLYEDCKKIVARLQNEGPVEGIDALIPNSSDKDFGLLAQSIRESIEKNQPEQALDRLHTFVIKYVRALCTRHAIAFEKATPLHSLFGLYVKFLQQHKVVESESRYLMLFNAVRNNRSLAHDNPMLNYNESVLIFNDISNTIRFVESIERKIVEREKIKPKEEIAWNDIEFSDEEIEAAGDPWIQSQIDIRRGK
jgi:hypothetical protein